MRNVVGIILGYITFGWSFFALVELLYWIMDKASYYEFYYIPFVSFIILLIGFETAYSTAYYLASSPVLLMATRNYPVIVFDVLVLLELVYKTYNFFNDNGFVLAYILAVIGIAIYVVIHILSFRTEEMELNGKKILTECLSSGYMDASEYLVQEEELRKANNKRMLIAFIWFTVVIGISYLIAYLV